MVLILGFILLAIIMYTIDNFLENRYLVKNKDVIQEKLDYYFQKYCIDEDSRKEIMKRLCLYEHESNLDEYLDDEISQAFYEIINKKLCYDKYRYFDNIASYKRINNSEYFYNSNYATNIFSNLDTKYRRVFVNNLLLVEKMMEKPLKKIEEIFNNDDLTFNEQIKIRAKIDTHIIIALNQFHEMCEKIAEINRQEHDRKEKAESEKREKFLSTLLDDSVFDDIDKYSDTIAHLMNNENKKKD